MKKIHVLLMLLLLVISAGCGSMNKIMKVQEISKIFGTPDYRRFDRGMEEWEYHSLSVIGGETKITVITFDEGRVSGMNTFVREVYTHPAPVPHIH